MTMGGATAVSHTEVQVGWCAIDVRGLRVMDYAFLPQSTPRVQRSGPEFNVGCRGS